MARPCRHVLDLTPHCVKAQAPWGLGQKCPPHVSALSLGPTGIQRLQILHLQGWWLALCGQDCVVASGEALHQTLVSSHLTSPPPLPSVPSPKGSWWQSPGFWTRFCSGFCSGAEEQGSQAPGILNFLKEIQPWLVWLSGLSAHLQTKWSPVWFSVRAHTWVAGQVRSPVQGTQ